MSDFFETFDGSLEQAEIEFGEPFFIDDVEYRALEIEQLTEAARATPGGAFTDVSVSLTVRSQIAAASGMKRGTTLKARGLMLRVIRSEVDGDKAITFLCGPQGVEIPRLR